MNFSIYNDNCFNILPTIPSKSVDLILIDPPFGITACAWDKKPDFIKLYDEFKRILKPNGVCIIFGDFKLLADLQTTPFRDHYSHQIVWNKLRTSNQLNAKKRPLQTNELINVYNFGKVKYNPQFFYGWNKKKEWVLQKPTDTKDNEIVEVHPTRSAGGSDPKYHSQPPHCGGTGKMKVQKPTDTKDNEIVEKIKLTNSTQAKYAYNRCITGKGSGLTGKKTNPNKKVEEAREGNATSLYEGEYQGNGIYNSMQMPATYTDPGYRYPTSIAPFQKRIGKSLHPTEKPVHLLEWLIKSYSDEGALVLDCFMGSGSCGEAALNTSRCFIGIELEQTFFQSAATRLKDKDE